MLRLGLHIFPLIQISCFVLAILMLEQNWLWSILLIFLAAIFLNFTLHITIHHYVHFKFKNKVLDTFFSFLYSAILVLPYNFYRMQHLNHHRFDNRIGDLTSTWKVVDQKIVAKNFMGYSFFWFINGASANGIKSSIENGDLTQSEFTKIKLQFLFILAIYTLLILLNPLAALAYGILFYLGWSMIAITNYGQHLPIKYDQPIAYSYSNKFYNALFFNNGLHLEHHEKPWLNYDELKPEGKAKIKSPHLLVKFLNPKTASKK